MKPTTFVIAGMCAVLGCDELSGGSRTTAVASGPSATVAGSGHPGSAPSDPSPEKSSSASTPAARGPAAAFTGRWEGRYDAKKGEVVVPQGVKDKTWSKDSGKTASGAGSITLTVSSDGEVTGKSRGALGNATLTGNADDTMLRATFLPDDPTHEHAMTGVLVGMLRDGGFKARLRVAGPDAAMVREADFEFMRVGEAVGTAGSSERVAPARSAP